MNYIFDLLFVNILVKSAAKKNISLKFNIKCINIQIEVLLIHLEVQYE